MKQYIKLSEYASRMHVSYHTAFLWFQAGKIPHAHQNPDTRRIYVEDIDDPPQTSTPTRAMLYARVSSTTNKASLEEQISRMRDFSSASGWQVVGEVSEIASGVNENRRKLSSILNHPEKYDILVVEHRDRLSRFGVRYIERIIKAQGNDLVIINTTEDDKAELIDDFVAIITSFCGKIYSRDHKRKTQEIIDSLGKEVRGENHVESLSH